MKGIKVKGIVLGLVALLLVAGIMGTVYARTNSDDNPQHKVDLKLSDQDEPWQDGVSATWTAANMSPGDEFAFYDSFVELRGKFPEKVDMGKLERKVEITCDYDPWTSLHPDEMAKYMVITRCIYKFTYKKEVWHIDCLTGELTIISKDRHDSYTNDQWQIQDVEPDGRVTFYDLKESPLSNLPFPHQGDVIEPRFEMSVKFHEDAGNEFQGDTFNLTMIYTLSAS